ncbi:adhesion G protein-coupled receptor B2 [Trichonephila clavipes]|nr:adhesion G protein-coupled receptor B2 [Trichonephila clavipes]
MYNGMERNCLIDESCFCLRHHEGWMHVGRHRSKTLLNCCVMPLHTRPASRYHDNPVASHFKYDSWHRTATAGSDVVQSGRPIFDDFFHYLWPYISNNTANVVFQMVKRLWLIRIERNDFT